MVIAAIGALPSAKVPPVLILHMGPADKLRDGSGLRLSDASRATR